jgi:hypothetical protein
MNHGSPTPERLPNRAPVFFWITVGLLAVLLLVGVAAALLLVGQARSINQSGGWGWLLVGGIYVAATTVVCFLCAVFASVSLFRNEPHRGLSIGVLIISCLVLFTFAPTLIRAANRLRRQHEEVAKDPGRPPASTIKELTEIRKIQNARPATAVRYSLTPKMMLWVRQKAANGTVGRGFLIGEQNGKWYIITLAGHTT